LGRVSKQRFDDPITTVVFVIVWTVELFPQRTLNALVPVGVVSVVQPIFGPIAA